MFPASGAKLKVENRPEGEVWYCRQPLGGLFFKKIY